MEHLTIKSMEKDIQITGVPTDFAQRLQALNYNKPEPTIATAYKSVNPSISPTEKLPTASEDYYKQQADQNINEDQIRNDTLNLFQKEIDATNNIYADKLREAQTQGISNLGSQRAMEARGGLLGSDFGYAQTANVEKQNKESQDSIRAEQLAKILEIQGKARAGAAAEIALKRKAKEEGLASYQKEYGSRIDRKLANINSFASDLVLQGIKPEELDPLKLKEIATGYGATPEEIQAAYIQAKVPYDATQAEIKAKREKENRITVNSGDKVFTLNTDGTYTEVANNPKAVLPSTGNKITLSEARTMGLPLSLVGQSENDIANSLASEQPPIWFKEKAENEAQMNFQYDKLSELWNDYRTKISNKNAEEESLF